MIARQLTEFGVTSLEKLVNAAVAYDTETAQLLDELNDITIALNINPPEWCCCISVHDGHIAIKSGASEEASVTLNGSIIAFAGILTQDRNAITLAGSGVTVAGDTLVLKRLENIFQKLDVDWEAALSDLVGDIPAHFAVTSLNTLARTAEDSRRRIVTGGVEFVQEEWKIVPAMPEFENFSQNIRKLSINVDRMTSRIDNLIQKIKT
jgi:ubiquinone biosynthesis protein UbiJ|tara:strand:+ start:4882 stop:5505 length:624 start_codon:yes stop_codon:yes gene_type:complete